MRRSRGRAWGGANADSEAIFEEAFRDLKMEPVGARCTGRSGIGSDLLNGTLLIPGRRYERLRIGSVPFFLTELPILESPSFLILSAEERHWALLEEILGKITYPAGNLFFDIRTATLMREHGVREIYTTDTDFLQFPDVKVINPLRII